LNGGLAPASRELVRRQLEVRYDDLTERARRNPNTRPAGTKAQFVTLYLDNLDAQYRVRAAQALGAIGGQRPRAALEAALAKAPRADVRAAIRTALNTIR
jgi:hypothetical protein